MIVVTFIVQVATEGRLTLEFTFDDLMRIRMWHFAIRHHYEMIPRSLLPAIQVCCLNSRLSFLHSNHAITDKPHPHCQLMTVSLLMRRISKHAKCCRWLVISSYFERVLSLAIGLISMLALLYL